MSPCGTTMCMRATWTRIQAGAHACMGLAPILVPHMRMGHIAGWLSCLPVYCGPRSKSVFKTVVASTGGVTAAGKRRPLGQDAATRGEATAGPWVGRARFQLHGRVRQAHGHREVRHSSGAVLQDAMTFTSRLLTMDDPGVSMGRKIQIGRALTSTRIHNNVLQASRRVWSVERHAHSAGLAPGILSIRFVITPHSSATAVDRKNDDFPSDPTYKKVPKNLAEVLDDSAHMLFMTEIARGFWYTLGAFFDKKVTVGAARRACVRACRPTRGGASALRPACMSAMCFFTNFQLTLTSASACLMPALCMQIMYPFEKGEPHGCPYVDAMPCVPCADAMSGWCDAVACTSTQAAMRLDTFWLATTFHPWMMRAELYGTGATLQPVNSGPCSRLLLHPQRWTASALPCLASPPQLIPHSVFHAFHLINLRASTSQAPSAPASVASMRCGATQQARSAALRASSARRCVRRRPSRLKPRSVRTAAGRPHGAGMRAKGGVAAWAQGLMGRLRGHADWWGNAWACRLMARLHAHATSCSPSSPHPFLDHSHPPHWPLNPVARCPLPLPPGAPHPCRPLPLTLPARCPSPLLPGAPDPSRPLPLAPPARCPSPVLPYAPLPSRLMPLTRPALCPSHVPPYAPHPSRPLPLTRPA
eukprot:355471-Chlamydomonas_euryale.AAC.13